MKKTALREFVSEEITLLEETSDVGRPKFRGVFQKCDEENRNKRIYSKGLWENVLDSSEIKKKLENKTMLGELNHPDYRDPNPENASHVVTKLWLSEDGKLVYGEAEILDTPKGRILESLLRAGVKIGVSSRGEGKVTEKEGKKYVKEDSYELITFDSVLEPSVEESTASLVESKFGLAMTTMLNEGKLGKNELSTLEQLTEQFDDQEIAGSIKSRILEAKSKINNPNKTNNRMSTEEQLLDRLAEANQDASDTKEALVRAEEKNKKFRNDIAELKTKLVGLRKERDKLAEIAKAVPTLKSDLKEEKAKLDKAVEVIEGMKKAFDEERTNKEQVEGYYKKALSVLEGVTAKVNSTKVEDYLEEELSDVGGIDRFRKILGNVDSLSLDEAKEKVGEIHNLVNEGTITSAVGGTRLKLREKNSKGKGNDKKKDLRPLGESKDTRGSMKSILSNM